MQSFSKKLAWITLSIIILASCAHGHIVNQLFFSLEKPGKEWKIKATFDAAYALPEFRDDTNIPQPAREWLFELSEQEHLRLKKEAESYLRQALSFTHGETTLDYQVSFPDYQSSPPDFPKMLNGGAYFTLVINGSLTNQNPGTFRIHVRNDPLPDFIVASGPSDNRSYHVVTPGNSAILFTTSGPGADATVEKSSMFSILKMGYRHVIPDGLDHLLFILALFLMARRWQALLTQSLAFTVAHSITLGLAASGVVQLNQWPGSWMIEPLIALSIAVVAIENLFTSENSRHRIIVIFLFGLIHGLGFAGSLGTALDQGSNTSLAALAVANLGVELAQITILAGAWIATMKWCRSDYYPKFRTAASATIALIGLFWMIERLMLIANTP